MNSPGLHYSSQCLCNRAHFTQCILLYLHAFIQRASLIPCNITAHLSVCIILLWLVRLWSCCSNGCQIPLLSRIYCYGNTMAVEWVQEDSEPANLYSGTEVIQTTKQNPKKENMTFSTRLFICKLHTACLPLMGELFIQSYGKYLNISMLIPKCKVFVISEGKVKINKCDFWLNINKGTLMSFLQQNCLSFLEKRE